MILVRNVFQMKFAEAKAVKALLKTYREGNAGRPPRPNERILFDLVGPSYTLVLEETFDSLAAFEAEMSGMMATNEWVEWYRQFSSHMVQSYREVFTVFE
ncbi:MAG: hypothetical protein SFW35_06770 [Chitinophagales bacterium]|nr:hypothetical protein [Chitinophagales bacterium]